MSSSEEYLDSLLASMSNSQDANSQDAVVLDGNDEEKTFENAYIGDYFEEFQKKGIISSDSDENVEGLDETFEPVVENDVTEEEIVEGVEESLLEEIIPEEIILDETPLEAEEIPSEEEVIPEDETLSEVQEEEFEAIEEEVFMDMADIDAILQDKSEVHPELVKQPEPVEEETANIDIDGELASMASELEDVGDIIIADDNLGISAEELMDIDDIDAMLAAASDNSNSEEAVVEFSGEDADLMEIQNLLQKSDQNEVVNDELLSMLDGYEDAEEEKEALEKAILGEDSEVSSEEEGKDKKKKKKEKKEKKSKKKASTDGEGEDNKEKKLSLIDKIKAFVFEDDEEAEEENGAKPDKKNKKGKKGKNTAPASEEDINAQIEAELAEEDKKNKKKKEKKPKKEKEPKAKKEKKIKVAKVPEPESFSERSTITKSGVIITALICVPILVVIIIFSYFLPKQSAKIAARSAYYNGDYETATLNLYGEKLNKSDQLIYKKASLLYNLQLHYDKYETYVLMNKDIEALNELFEGRKLCDEIAVEANTLNISKDVEVLRAKFNSEISGKYGITQEQIDEICSLKPLHYTIALEDLISGKGYATAGEDEAVEPVEQLEDALPEEDEESLEDMLPEETILEENDNENTSHEIVITGEDDMGSILESLNGFMNN